MGVSKPVLSDLAYATVLAGILLPFYGCESKQLAERPTEPDKTIQQSDEAITTASDALTGPQAIDAGSASKQEAGKQEAGKQEAAPDSTAVVPVKLPSDKEIDPTSDGWDSEQFSAQASDQLSKLGKLIQSRELTTESAAEFVSEGCRIYPLPEPQTERMLSNETILVQNFGHRNTDDSSAIRRGSAGFTETITELLKPWSGPLTRTKFKLVGTSLTENSWETRQLVSLAGKSAQGLVDWHGTWITQWTSGSNEELPRLTKVQFVDAQLTTSRSEGTWFTEKTSVVVAGAKWYQEQSLPGVDYWQQHLESILTGQFGHHGLAIGDINNDGLDDVYVCQPGGLPNLLLVQQTDGTVRNRSQEAGVDFLDLSRSALLIDFDNDGDQDLVLATSNRLVFLSNDGSAKFRRQVTFDSVRDANSLCAADYDLDNDLDVYVCVYSGDGGKSRGSPTPVPIHDAQNGGANFLFRNDSVAGKLAFADATDQVGLDADNHRWSYAAAWEDYDADGDADLYVANDFGTNNLYRNEGGRFVEASREAGINESAFGMSVTWGDYNRDGHLDVYVSNMFSGAGSRITTQEKFQPKATSAIRQKLRYAARGNTLYANQGDGTFRDESVAANVTMGRWAWGSQFLDINNDSWEDLLVGNGFVTRENAPDL